MKNLLRSWKKGILLSALFGGITFAGVDLNKGLVAYWSFDNCNAKDDSGNGHDGIIYGNPQCVDGIKGKAFYLHWGDFIQTDSFKWSTNQFTIAGWIKPKFINGMDGCWIGFVSKGGDGYLCSKKNSFNLEFCNGKGHVRFGEICWYDQFYTSEPMVQIGEYSFVVVSYDGSYLKFYKNGELIDYYYIISTINSAESPIFIGADFPGSDNYLEGTIDEIRIYNRALTDEEVKALYEYYTNPTASENGTLPTPFGCECLTKEDIEKLPEGWNMVGLPCEMSKTQMEETFDEVVIVWNWDNENKKWKVYSPNTNLMNLVTQLGYEAIENLSKKSAVWILKK